MSKDLTLPTNLQDRVDALDDALDDASDQSQTTYVLDALGKRIAAIVPVDVAEKHEQDIAAVLKTQVSLPSSISVPVALVKMLQHALQAGGLHTLVVPNETQAQMVRNGLARMSPGNTDVIVRVDESVANATLKAGHLQ